MFVEVRDFPKGWISKDSRDCYWCSDDLVVWFGMYLVEICVDYLIDDLFCLDTWLDAMIPYRCVDVWVLICLVFVWLWLLWMMISCEVNCEVCE